MASNEGEQRQELAHRAGRNVLLTIAAHKSLILTSLSLAIFRWNPAEIRRNPGRDKFSSEPV
jgi:hypothetical protein